jgi:hypothetical protein
MFKELKEKSFEEADVEKLVKLLNLVHTKISGLSGEEAFEYFKLMAWAQNTVLNKMKAHVLGEPKIVEDKEAI